MSYYAISDLHLSLQTNKPMDVFGSTWTDHPSRIQKAWSSIVNAEDYVLIPGDISWAMRFHEATEDFAFLERLPGTKVIGRGNHDYYWHSHQKMLDFLPAGMIPLDRHILQLPDFVLGSTKGWVCPGSSGYTPSEDEKYYKLEVRRLEMVLKKMGTDVGPRVIMLHFPPTNEKLEPSLFTQLLEDYKVRLCIFGHLHGSSLKKAYDREQNHVHYQLVSADYLDFQPLLLDSFIKKEV